MRVGPRSSIRAFTLIETLVVIAIVTLLLSLLLPALAKSRRLSQSTVCAANQKQLHTAMYNYLVNEDALPRLTVQFDARPPFQSPADLNVPYWLAPAVWHANATKSQFVNFGKYWEARLIDSPQVFFCPTQTHPEFQFDTPVNPWPPDPVSAYTPGLEFHYWNDVLSSYSRRLGLSWVQFDNVHPGTAIMADVMELPDYALTHHEKAAFNYATADGAVSSTDDGWFRDPAQAPTLNTLSDVSLRWLAAYRRLDRAGVPDTWWK